jgi:hypothetical protein
MFAFMEGIWVRTEDWALERVAKGVEEEPSFVSEPVGEMYTSFAVAKAFASARRHIKDLMAGKLLRLRSRATWSSPPFKHFVAHA